MPKPLAMLGRLAATVLLVVPVITSTTVQADEYTPKGPVCGHGSPLCPDLADSQALIGHYVGHDEPSLLFYSNQPGSGNSLQSSLRLPKDPPVMPNATGTGGTWNFQLHPAFWFGMALCDNQSAPLPSDKPCRADSDSNIYTSLDPKSPKYIGKHPGTAFLEVQFYPPGWVAWPASQIINGGSSCDATKWCAAVAVFSFQANLNQVNRYNNPDCQLNTSRESFNFAFITLNGRPTGPPNPLGQTTRGTFTPDPTRDLFMNSGDVINVDLHDTRGGLSVNLDDQNTGQRGSMVMGPRNGFAQVVFNQDPNAKCTERPYAFHPMYSTSSENTRVVWAAHSYNVAFSDEIGHFEYCPKVDQFNGSCVSPSSASDPAGPDGDDQGNCATADDSTLVKIDGCTGTDDDFDGPEYKATWPGTGSPATDRMTKPTPIQFTSPVFNGESNYSRVAFEADLAAIESPPCSTLTGTGCTNPPPGAAFYPIFSTARADGENLDGCIWQFGGPSIPGTTNNFGGNSTTEFGAAPFALDYPRPSGPVKRWEDFRTILPNNPCRAGDNQGQGGQGN